MSASATTERPTTSRFATEPTTRWPGAGPSLRAEAKPRRRCVFGARGVRLRETPPSRSPDYADHRHSEEKEHEDRGIGGGLDQRPYAGDVEYRSAVALQGTGRARRRPLCHGGRDRARIMAAQELAPLLRLATARQLARHVLCAGRTDVECLRVRRNGDHHHAQIG